jgi:uncharacterized damage-inducible protein DinB
MGGSLRIKRQLETAFKGPAWHGPSLMDNLNGVTAEAAAAKPFPETHSIWEIVNHVLAWQKMAIATIDGASYATLKDDADFPPVVSNSDGEWASVVAELQSSFATLCAKLDEFSDERLKENIPGADYPWGVLLRGIAEHDLYHAGQIGLLKRAAQ